MKLDWCTPEEQGLSIKEPRGTLGRAERFATADSGELYRVSAAELSLAEALLRFGKQGVGGFVQAGQDEHGIWLLRELPEPSLQTLFRREEKLRFRQATALVHSLAVVLSNCEWAGVLVDRVTPERVVHRPATHRVWLPADPLIYEKLGAAERVDPQRLSAEASPRWLPPAQADGAPWDAAANRYVLGLILYRLLSGEDPDHKRGLRVALEERARRGAMPFSETVAASLPPGLQSFSLRLLARDVEERPRSAAEIAQQLEKYLGGAGPELTRALPSLSTAESPPVSTAESPSLSTSASTASGSTEANDSRVLGEDESPGEQHTSPREQHTADDPSRRGLPAKPPRSLAAAAERSRLQRVLLFIGIGLLLMAGVLISKLTAKPSVERRVPRARALLTEAATRAVDCGQCHPRQSAEWQRSVMAHSVKSPLFEALEILIEEQVGRHAGCPNGAGVLRKAGDRGACTDPKTGLRSTGSGGEHWCVNCHAPGENLRAALPAWDGLSNVSRSRRPLASLLPASSMEGVSCAFCHQVHGPVRPDRPARASYQGNPFWTSTRSGARFLMRPEDATGVFGISNSGYSLSGSILFANKFTPLADVVGGAHLRLTPETRRYLNSSEFCGACHDVRLFGTDVLGRKRGEHFKRLRNAYSEWRDWAEQRKREQKPVYSCQDCHMSSYPGRCVPQAGKKPVASVGSALAEAACPPGTRFVAEAPGRRPKGLVAASSTRLEPVRPHYFTGVDIPLSPEFAADLVSDRVTDTFGIPLGAAQRRNLLLASAIRFSMAEPELERGRIRIRLSFENVGAGHRIPAGFSQERELWVHLKVTDAEGRLVYEVGRVDSPTEDLHDKLFARVNVDDRSLDSLGRPLGLFGADVLDGPDVPDWRPAPERGGRSFIGQGLINFQNGFLRCVLCLGQIDGQGKCRPLPGQERSRADRFADADYDPDTGQCRSNLSGMAALFETYFPVGALDATRGVLKAPDAIIDTRSLPPEVPIEYRYDLAQGSSRPPYQVEARLLFRAFPPYLLRAFAEYERVQSSRGLRPNGPLVTPAMLERLEIVELSRITHPTAG